MRQVPVVSSSRHHALTVLLIALPWLSPLAFGPSPAVLSWLIALSTTAGLLLLSSIWGNQRGGVYRAGDWTYCAARAWGLAGVASAVAGLLQYVGAAQVFLPWINQASLGEAFANLRQRNQFATLTNIALVALLWCVGRSQPSMDRPNVQGVAAYGVMLMALILALGNAASSSRTGLLQICLSIALAGIWGGLRSPPVRNVLLVYVFGYVVALFLLPSLIAMDPLTHGAWARFRMESSPCGSRLTLWTNVLHLIAQKPWFGWGWGELDYAHYMTRYPGARFCEILGNAHNLPLHLAVELGLPVALGTCGTVAWLVQRARPWRETDPTRQLAWGVLALIGLHSLLEYPLWYGPFQMAVGLCVLMLWRGNHPLGDQKLKENWALAHRCRAPIAICLIAVASYAAWDYHRISQIYRAPDARDTAYREDTLAKIRNSWLFANQVSFAELSLTPLTQANAQWTLATAKALLHYSPEPRVIEKVIESAVMLGRDDEALLHLARYRAAFPQAHAKWREANGLVGNLED